MMRLNDREAFLKLEPATRALADTLAETGAALESLLPQIETLAGGATAPGAPQYVTVERRTLHTLGATLSIRARKCWEAIEASPIKPTLFPEGLKPNGAGT